MSDTAALKHFAIFADLGDADREELTALLEERDLSNGETLFEEGDDADSLLLVQNGCVDLISRRSPATLSIGAGETLGGLALFAVGSREMRAVGRGATSLRQLRREDFLRFAEDHPRAAFRIAAALASEVAVHARAALGTALDARFPVDPSERGE